MTVNTPVQNFSPFSLKRLLKSAFAPDPGERLALLIDIEDPELIQDFAFLKQPNLTVQRYANDVFYQGLHTGVMEELGLQGGNIFAYKTTGGSNLELPDSAFDINGRKLNLAADICANHDIIIALSTYSATAPLLALAKKYYFRGATMHGIDQSIIDTGLSVDYVQVSEETERLRKGMTKADSIEVDFEVGGEQHSLKVELGGRPAGASRGDCRDKRPNIENLPDGEVYYLPKSAEGNFPFTYEDGTLALMEVEGCKIVGASLISGNQFTIDSHLAKIADDPATGVICELGFGTQMFPLTGHDIQDEKVLGTLHLATGRCDHLGGHLGPKEFVKAENATHDDFLFNPLNTPEIQVPQVRMNRNGSTEVLIEYYQPSTYMLSLLSA